MAGDSVEESLASWQGPGYMLKHYTIKNIRLILTSMCLSQLEPLSYDYIVSLQQDEW